MKTLLERLKPEIKEIFDAEARNYPNIVRFIMGALDQATWVGELKLSIVADIASVEGLKEHLGVEFPDMYLINNLNKMFNAE